MLETMGSYLKRRPYLVNNWYDQAFIIISLKPAKFCYANVNKQNNNQQLKITKYSKPLVKIKNGFTDSGSKKGRVKKIFWDFQKKYS